MNGVNSFQQPSAIALPDAVPGSIKGLQGGARRPTGPEGRPTGQVHRSVVQVVRNSI
jgi:hypothetical protein